MDNRSITSKENGKLGGRPKELIDFEPLEGENWRPIEGFESYFVSDHGRVISVKKGKPFVKKNSCDPNGYPRTSLFKQNKHHTKRIHRLVLETFSKKRPDDMEASHIDHNKHNNHISNLIWETHKDNIKRNIDRGIGSVGTRGEKNPSATLTEQKVLDIRKFYKENNHLSQREIGEVFGINSRLVCKIVNRERWTHI